MMSKRKEDSLCWTHMVLLLGLVCGASGLTAEDDFYPYGTSNGDSSLPRQNDDYISINLQRAFPFGGKYHSMLYISDNGVISFDEPVYVESDRGFERNLPFYYDVDGDGSDAEQPDAILPFWSDVDISESGLGNVFYRVTTASNVINRATADVRKYFRSNPTFTAQVVIIVTWDAVSFYQYGGDGEGPRNTFQAVLIHDGQESFVFFMYADITWATGTKMGGDDETGTGAVSGFAVVGFNVLNGVNNFKVPLTSENAVLQIETHTNYDDPSGSENNLDGLYVYKVDGLEVIELQCSQTVGSELMLTPSRCGMMGGEKIYLFGPCWEPTAMYECVFLYQNGGAANDELQRVTATVISTNEAYCVPDPFFLVGEVTLFVVRENEDLETSPSATYSLLESGRITPTITRRTQYSSSWEMAGMSNTIDWDIDAESFGSDMLTISVLAYREDGSSGPRWESVFEISNTTTDTGSLTFTGEAQEGVTADNAFGVIRLTANTENRERVLWSDLHPLGYLLEDSYQNDHFGWAKSHCDAWVLDDTNVKPPFHEYLPACPCTLDQATQDVGKFITDPSCYPRTDGVATCEDNEGAVHCFLSAYASRETSSGVKCCYMANGLLMYAGEDKYAGMSGRSHVRGASPYREQNLVPVLSHWSNDLIAYHFCCEWAGGDECFSYRERRPTPDCIGYEAPTMALSFGDPHFVTMDGYNYTFNGLGEYTMLRYAQNTIGDFMFELQGRQVQTKSRTGPLVAVTQLSSVAMRDDTTGMESDAVFIQASASSGMDVYRKAPSSTSWRSVYFSEQTFTDLQGCSIGVTEFRNSVEIFGLVVMFKGTGIAVQVNVEYGMLAVRPILPPTLDSSLLTGLLGNNDGNPDNDIRTRTGVLIEDPSPEALLDFGNSWEVEESLFFYIGSMKHEDYHNSSFVPILRPTLPELYSACNDMEQCLFDYAVSNEDANLAAATLQAYEDFEESALQLAKIDVCPYIGEPRNGTKTYTDNNNRNQEGAIVTYRCDPDLILVGSSVRACEAESEGTLVWTGQPDGNDCIESACGGLDTPEYGSIVITDGGLTATFQCDDGYTRNGASESSCVDGEWTNPPPTCTAGGEVNVVGIAVGVSISVIIIILLVVLGLLYYKKKQKKPKSKKAKTTDDRDAELAEPLNKKPTDTTRASTRSSSSNKSNDGNKGPSAQIYQPTPMSQASVKYNAGDNGKKSGSTKPPPPVEKDPELNLELKKTQPEVKPATTVVDEQVPLAQQAAQTQSAPPPYKPTEAPPVKPKTPDSLRKEPASSSYAASESASYQSSKASAAPAPSVGYKTPSRDEADMVKGTGLLTNTNIQGTGGWI